MRARKESHNLVTSIDRWILCVCSVKTNHFFPFLINDSSRVSSNLEEVKFAVHFWYNHLFPFFFCSDVIDEWDDECEPDTLWPPLHVNRKDTRLDWTFGLLDSVTKRVAKLLSIVLVWYPSLARNYCLKKHISKKCKKEI